MMSTGSKFLTYCMLWHTTNNKCSTYHIVESDRPVIISGPSGVGKGTMVTRILEAHPGKFSTTVSHTTRLPRQGEIDGVTYHFISRLQFEEMIAKGAFIEYTTFSGNYYGTSKRTIRDQNAKGKIALLDIDIDGLKQVKRSGLETQSIFLMPPSIEELERRLRGRGTETEESIQRRLGRASAEIEYAMTSYAYDHVIINDGIDQAYRDLESLLLGAPAG